MRIAELCMLVRNMAAQIAKLCIALLCGWALVAPAHRVMAQASVALPSVQYTAPEGCPDRADFTERVGERLRAEGPPVPRGTTALSLRVTLKLRADRSYAGSLEIARGATQSQRHVEAPRCDEVVEALTLIAAFALREAQLNEPRARDGNEANVAADGRGGRVTRATARPPRRDASRPRGRRRAGGGTVPAEQVPANEPGTTRERHVAEPADEPAAAAIPTDQPAASAAVPSSGDDARASGVPRLDRTRPASEPSEPTSTERADAAKAAGAASQAQIWSLGAGGLLLRGLAPAWQAGLQLEAALQLGSGALRFGVQLGARVALRDELRSPQGDAWFQFLGAVVRGCVSIHVMSRHALSGCAVVEPGVFRAGADNTQNPRTHSRAWLAVGAAAELDVALTAWLGLRFGAELVSPFRRDRVVLAGEPVYRVPALGVRLQLGPSLTWQ